MDEQFVNVYIEIMNNKINELIKSEILLGARLVLSEKIVANLILERDNLAAQLSNYTTPQVPAQPKTGASGKKNKDDF